MSNRQEVYVKTNAGWRRVALEHPLPTPGIESRVRLIKISDFTTCTRPYLNRGRTKLLHQRDHCTNLPLNLMLCSQNRFLCANLRFKVFIAFDEVVFWKFDFIMKFEV